MEAAKIDEFSGDMNDEAHVERTELMWLQT